MLYLFEIYAIVVTFVFILALGVSLILYVSVFVTQLFRMAGPVKSQAISEVPDLGPASSFEAPQLVQPRSGERM